MITLTDKELDTLRTLFSGETIRSGPDLVDKIRRSQTIRFKDVLDMELDKDSLWMLLQQADGMGRPYEEYVKDFIAEAIHYAITGQNLARRV